MGFNLAFKGLTLEKINRIGQLCQLTILLVVYSSCAVLDNSVYCWLISVIYSVICFLHLLQYQSWGRELDEGRVPEGITAMLEELGAIKQEK
jgi:hypothetical protein